MPVPPLRNDYQLIHMTLGNGYLGSRIDEERSKMRYLV
jgi:trehalose/maltose hydrolase-like predicted phosphorylase